MVIVIKYLYPLYSNGLFFVTQQSGQVSILKTQKINKRQRGNSTALLLL